jgi:hypothetical protein
VKGLSVVVPCLALILATAAWLAGLPLWAVITTFFLAGPCAVVAAFLVQAVDTGRTPGSPAPGPAAQPPSTDADSARSIAPDGGHP